MIERRLLAGLLAAVVPIVGGCNAILGIETHPLAPDGGQARTSVRTGCSGVGMADDSQGVDADAETNYGFAMPNPVGAGLPNPASYTQNFGTNTVTDNVTGLTWEGAVEPKTVYTQPQARRRCNEKNGGWRLPTRVELVSLVDFTRPKPGPTINAIFRDTPGERFWTSSLAAFSETAAWYVGFDLGATHQVLTSDAYKVRCVLGAPSRCPTRFQIQAGELVRDRTTGLVWQRPIAVQQKVWSEAMKYCPTLGTGWRLPSLNELQTLVDEDKETPAIDGDAFPNTPPKDYFWTSSPQAGHADFAWYVTFFHGHSDVDLVTNPFWIRCVR